MTSKNKAGHRNSRTELERNSLVPCIWTTQRFWKKLAIFPEPVPSPTTRRSNSWIWWGTWRSFSASWRKPLERPSKSSAFYCENVGPKPNMCPFSMRLEPKSHQRRRASSPQKQSRIYFTPRDWGRNSSCRKTVFQLGRDFRETPFCWTWLRTRASSGR